MDCCATTNGRLHDDRDRVFADSTGLLEAIVSGAHRRFRPILLTSLTTFFGLMPMLLETEVQAQFLAPMAVSLGFGVMAATGITLIIVPVVYHILQDFKATVHKVGGLGEPKAPESEG